MRKQFGNNSGDEEKKGLSSKSSKSINKMANHFTPNYYAPSQASSSMQAAASTSGFNSHPTYFKNKPVAVQRHFCSGMKKAFPKRVINGGSTSGNAPRNVPVIDISDSSDSEDDDVRARPSHEFQGSNTLDENNSHSSLNGSDDRNRYNRSPIVVFHENCDSMSEDDGSYMPDDMNQFDSEDDEPPNVEQICAAYSAEYTGEFDYLYSSASMIEYSIIYNTDRDNQQSVSNDGDDIAQAGPSQNLQSNESSLQGLELKPPREADPIDDSRDRNGTLKKYSCRKCRRVVFQGEPECSYCFENSHIVVKLREDMYYEEQETQVSKNSEQDTQAVEVVKRVRKQCICCLKYFLKYDKVRIYNRCMCVFHEKCARKWRRVSKKKGCAGHLP